MIRRWLTGTADGAGANPSKLPFGKYSLTIQLGDVLDASAVDDVVFARDAVIMRKESSQQLDAFSHGVANIVTAMQANSVRRLVVIAGGILFRPHHWPDACGIARC